MVEEDKMKTAFMTESGNYCYNIMPFGLRNAGATYQRMMKKVYDKTLLGDILEVYMDDMIVNPNKRWIMPPTSKECSSKLGNTTCDSTQKNAPLESKQVNSLVSI
jgi:hypothetical protein